MKKALIIAAVSLLACACSGSIAIDSPHLAYAQKIQEQLKATEWCYTYKKVEPNKNSAYIIDFYVLEPLRDYSQWLCFKENNEIQCEMLFVKHL